MRTRSTWFPLSGRFPQRHRRLLVFVATVLFGGTYPVFAQAPVPAQSADDAALRRQHQRDQDAFLRTLTTTSDDAIDGIIEHVESDWAEVDLGGGPERIIATTYRVRVLEVIFGTTAAAGDLLILWYPGGSVAGEEYRTSTSPTLAPGERIIALTDIYKPNGRLAFNNGSLGLVRVRADGAIEGRSDSADTFKAMIASFTR